MTVLLIVLVGLGTFAAGFWIKSLLGRKQVETAEQKAKQLLDEAGRQAEATRKQAQMWFLHRQ